MSFVPLEHGLACPGAIKRLRGDAPVLTLNLHRNLNLSDEHPEIKIKKKIMIKTGEDSLLDSNPRGG